MSFLRSRDVVDRQPAVGSERHDQIISVVTRVSHGRQVHAHEVLTDVLDSVQMLELAAALEDVGIRIPEEKLAGLTMAALLELHRGGHLGVTDTQSEPPRVTPSLSFPLSAGAFGLAPVTPDLEPFLYSLAVDERVGYRWRFRGTVPPPQVFVESLWQGVLAQFVVVRSGTRAPLGHVVAYNHDAAGRHAHIGAVFAGDTHNTGIPLAATLHFVRYLFHTWNFQKLYLELPSFNYSQFSSGVGKYFHEEGRLIDYEYYAGRSWDRVILAVRREDVQQISSRV